MTSQCICLFKQQMVEFFFLFNWEQVLQPAVGLYFVCDVRFFFPRDERGRMKKGS